MNDSASPPRSPPLVLRVLYGLRFIRLGPKWKDWVERDVAQPSFVGWMAAVTLVAAAVSGAVITPLRGEIPVVFMATYITVGWAALLFSRYRRYVRDMVLASHRKKWSKGRGPAPEAPAP